MSFFIFVPFTFHVGLPRAEGGDEASSPGALVRHHLQHHGVGGGDDGARPERPTEAPQLLHQAGVTVVDVQVVVTTGGVGLHVEEAEGQHHHVTLWDLEKTMCLAVVASGEEELWSIMT